MLPLMLTEVLMLLILQMPLQVRTLILPAVLLMLLEMLLQMLLLMATERPLLPHLSLGSWIGKASVAAVPSGCQMLQVLQWPLKGPQSQVLWLALHVPQELQVL